MFLSVRRVIHKDITQETKKKKEKEEIMRSRKQRNQAVPKTARTSLLRPAERPIRPQKNET